MTDDIVTRLRKALQYEDGYQMTIAPEAVAAIANEIERLRELLWKYEHCEMVCESPCDLDWEDGECETCDKHRKAVRGE